MKQEEIPVPGHPPIIIQGKGSKVHLSFDGTTETYPIRELFKEDREVVGVGGSRALIGFTKSWGHPQWSATVDGVEVPTTEFNASKLMQGAGSICMMLAGLSVIGAVLILFGVFGQSSFLDVVAQLCIAGLYGVFGYLIRAKQSLLAAVSALGLGVVDLISSFVLAVESGAGVSGAAMRGTLAIFLISGIVGGMRLRKARSASGLGGTGLGENG